jgi:flagellar biosynthesis protein FlhG
MNQSQRAIVMRGLQELEDRADYILIDTGAGIARNVVSMVLAADESLVVTTPDPTAVTDAYAMIKLIALQNSAQPVRLLVNMAMQAQEAEAVSRRIRDVCRQFLHFTVGSWLYVPMDTAVALSVRSKQPFILADRQSEAARSLYAFAQELLRQDMHRGQPSAPAAGGFFSRLAGRFFCAGQGEQVS